MEKKLKNKFAVNDSNTLVTLKQGQGHYVDPKQGYNHAKFEISRFNSVREKANLFFSNEEIYQLYILNTRESGEKSRRRRKKSDVFII